MKIFQLGLLALILTFSGCAVGLAHYGTDLSTAKLSQLQINHTTYPEVLALLGPPVSVMDMNQAMPIPVPGAPASIQSKTASYVMLTCLKFEADYSCEQYEGTTSVSLQFDKKDILTGITKIDMGNGRMPLIR